MAIRGSRRGQQQARSEAERARLYAARKGWHEKQISRRRRDTWLASVVGGLVVIGAIVSQTVFGVVNAPEPTPLPTPTKTEAPASPEPTPDETPAETPSPTPTQTPGE